MGFWSNLLGSKKVVEKGIDIADESIYTRQEKAETTVLLTSDVVSSLTRKILALSTNFVMLATFVYAVILHTVFKQDITGIIDIADSFSIGAICIAQNGFYFTASTLNKIASSDKKRALEKLEEEKNMQLQKLIKLNEELKKSIVTKDRLIEVYEKDLELYSTKYGSLR